MSPLAPTLQLFFTERLINQRQASPATITSYRTTFQLLLRFVGDRTRALRLRALLCRSVSRCCRNAEMASASRSVNSSTEGASRLAALRSLFRFAALRHPEHAELIGQVLAIPQKRCDRTDVSFLQPHEVDALLAAPDRSRWEGRRDHALLLLAIQTGLRLSELTGLTCADIQLGPGAHARCRGKGRKQQCVPLTPATTAVLRVWFHERHEHLNQPAFPTRTGRRLSDDAVEARLNLYKDIARQRCPSLEGKRLTPHTLRHTCTMNLLHSGVDSAVIALWLGHTDPRSTAAYLHADMAIKERALARTTPPTTKPGRYQPPDDLLAFLESL
ncbi:tyrosine-type recombinase/integrase [Nocardia sp. NPDC059239]|uniref:tyrosine-type recombinase/integrase n=1 Tax=Nocardia sp. NPDC059239 TaxID=3346785 RepID=UPI00367EA3EA